MQSANKAAKSAKAAAAKVRAKAAIEAEAIIEAETDVAETGATIDMDTTTATTLISAETSKEEPADSLKKPNKRQRLALKRAAAASAAGIAPLKGPQHHVKEATIKDVVSEPEHDGWAGIPLSEAVRKALLELRFRGPTLVQQMALEAALECNTGLPTKSHIVGAGGCIFFFLVGVCFFLEESR